ncbi:hypothetical protein DYB25_007139 [Aphanomyces astaci]|nr:hypothetical protein DYB25_007139 [Aphanomyces astaci]
MIGEYYADRHKWEKAIKYYAQASNVPALVQCYYTLGDFTTLDTLVNDLPEGSPLLEEMARKFTRAGLCNSAVNAFLKMGDIKSAIDSCVLLNEWERAVTLAETHHFPQIETVLAKYGTHLMRNGKTLQAIELYRRANKSMDAAKLLGKLAKEVSKNPLRAKKLQMLSHSGAEAFHLCLLAHRQLYRGQPERALRTSLKLASYDDIVDEREVYSLIAIAAYYTKHYEQCSRACNQLEMVLVDKDKAALDALTLQIFSTTRPFDPPTRPYECPSCKHPVKEWAAKCDGCGRGFQTCMMSGATILDHRTYMCKTCRHSCIEHEIRDVSNCPLCHAALK